MLLHVPAILDAAQVTRDRVPQALLEHDETAANLVERSRPFITYIARAPRRQISPGPAHSHPGCQQASGQRSIAAPWEVVQSTKE